MAGSTCPYQELGYIADCEVANRVGGQSQTELIEERWGSGREGGREGEEDERGERGRFGKEGGRERGKEGGWTHEECESRRGRQR